MKYADIVNGLGLAWCFRCGRHHAVTEHVPLPAPCRRTNCRIPRWMHAPRRLF